MIINFLVALNSFLPLSKLALWMTLLVRKALALYHNICWYTSSEFDDSKTRVENTYVDIKETNSFFSYAHKLYLGVPK